MASSSTFPSATPILDSAVLPPKRKDLRSILFGILLGVVFAILLIAESNRMRSPGHPQANFTIATYLLATTLAIVLHELGHLLAGWMVGFHFSSFTIGPFSVLLEYGKLRVRVRRSLPAGGYAGMHVDRVRRLRRRLLIFIAAGPAANLLTMAIALMVLSSDPVIGGWLSSFIRLFWMISAVLGIGNLLPFRLGVLYPDGARIWMLLFSRAKARRWLSVAAIGSQSRAGVRSRDFRRTWLNTAGSVQDGSVDEFAANWVAYMAANDRKDVPAAAAHLERCLGLVNLLGPVLQDLLAIEATVFTAWFRADPALSQKWFANVKRIKTLPRLMQIRAQIALSCGKKEYGSALLQWQEGFAVIEKLPPTPIKAKLAEGFLEWKAEICERERAYQPTPSAVSV